MHSFTPYGIVHFLSHVSSQFQLSCIALLAIQHIWNPPSPVAITVLIDSDIDVRYTHLVF